MITPRQAELLSYLTGLGTAGVWVIPDPAGLRADLGVTSRAWVCIRARALVKAGLIEKRRDGRATAFRVIRRIEDGVRIGVKPSGRPKAWDWGNVYKERFHA